MHHKKYLAKTHTIKNRVTTDVIVPKEQLIMQEKTCKIIGAGEFSNFNFDQDDFIIAADGGYDHLKKINIKPDILIGDFDSMLDKKSNLDPDIKKIGFSTEKDFTDLDLAVQHAIKLGYNKFDIYGAIGGRRFDHSIANIQLLAGLSQKKFKVCLHSKKNIITAISDTKIFFDKTQNGVVAVFSHTDKSFGVDILGLKYELRNETLYNTRPLGISNEFTQKQSMISVRSGTLIIILQA